MSLATLPTELMTLICAFTVPPYVISSDTEVFVDRYPTLSILCLVNRTFYPIARNLLYKHIRLLSTNTRAFLYSIGIKYTNWDPPTDIATNWVESLVIGNLKHSSECPFEPRLLSRLTACLPSLKELWVILMENVDLTSLSISAELESLHLDTVVLRPLSGDCDEAYLLPYFPKLRYISINNVSTEDDLLTIFNPKSFPKVTAVACRFQPAIPEDYQQSLFIPRAADIDSLFLGRFNTNTLFALEVAVRLPALSLTRFATNNPSELQQHLSLLYASNLVYLEVGVHYLCRYGFDLDEENILPILREPPNCIKGLKKLSLPVVWDWDWRGRMKNRNNINNPGMRDAVEARKKTRELCVRMGIELVERPLTEDGEDFPVRWFDVWA